MFECLILQNHAVVTATNANMYLHFKTAVNDLQAQATSTCYSKDKQGACKHPEPQSIDS